jgi:polysaccharide biosynthesis transport protein
MSVQPTSIVLEPRLSLPPEESPVASLLQTVSKVLDVLRRRWPLLVVPMLTVMLIVLSLGLTYPRCFYVTTTFERRNNLVISKLITNNSPYSFTALRQSLVADLRSFSTVGVVVEEMGLLDGLPREASGELTAQGRAMRDDKVGQWVDSITVLIRETGDFSDIVEVRYLGPMPELAAQILNRLRDNYIAATRARVTSVINDAHAFFEQEAQKCQEKVAALRAEIRQIDLEHPGTNPGGAETAENRLQAVSLTVEQLDRERQKLQAGISACEAFLAEMTTRPASDALQAQANRSVAVDRASAPNPAYLSVATEIASLNKKIDELKSARRMTDMHPDVVTLRRRIESLQENLDAMPEHLDVSAGAPSSAAVDPWMAERKKTEIDIKAHRENLARIERELKTSLEEQARLKKQMESLPERREQYAKLQQAAQNAQNDLDLWTNNMSQLNRILTAEAENRGIQVAVLDHPHLAGRLHLPTANRFFALSSGLGLALAILIVFLREILDRSVKDPARVKQVLGIPVLETIGEISVHRAPGWFVRRRLLPAFVIVQTLAVGVLGTLVYLALERPELYDRVAARYASLLGGWAGGT